MGNQLGKQLIAMVEEVQPQLLRLQPCKPLSKLVEHPNCVWVYLLLSDLPPNKKYIKLEILLVSQKKAQKRGEPSKREMQNLQALGPQNLWGFGIARARRARDGGAGNRAPGAAGPDSQLLIRTLKGGANKNPLCLVIFLELMR